MATRKTISDAQKLILSNAAARADEGIFPTPTEFRARGAVRQKVLAVLLKHGLVAERPTADDAAVWRRDSRRHRLTLVLTTAGLNAIGLVTNSAGAPVPPPVIDPALPDRVPATPGGKLGSVLSALVGERGATLDALVTLTGWLPHTTRAALCRLRQRGYPIRLVGDAGRKAYRLDIPAQG